MQFKLRNNSFVLTGIALLTTFGCNKMVQVPLPVSSVTSEKLFSKDAGANSAVAAIYSDMTSTGGYISYANGGLTVYAGMYADELISNGYSGDLPFQEDAILATDATLNGLFWVPPYRHIYMANAVIEGLSASTTVSSAAKDQYTGEAKFIRAFSHFCLVNLFGDIPLVTTTSWEKINTLPRSPSADVYQQIVSDLKDAQGLLVADYSTSNGERIRANKWAATALLARVYLYMGDWKDAEAQATLLINNTSDFSLLPDLNSVFLANSAEAIWQLQTIDNQPWATQEGNLLVPVDSLTLPNYDLSDQLLNAFEPGDLRRQAWVDSSDYSGTYFYYPFKYKIYQGTSGNITEYYMVLRLAEQYLIRAEARARQNTNLSGAEADLNLIRERAGLPDLPIGLDQTATLAAVAQERRIELFAECGHRWFDLKRTNQAAVVVGSPQTRLVK